MDTLPEHGFDAWYTYQLKEVEKWNEGLAFHVRRGFKLK